MPVHHHGVSKCILTIKRGHQVHFDDELSIYILLVILCDYGSVCMSVLKKRNDFGYQHQTHFQQLYNWLNFSTAWWKMQLISVEENLMHMTGLKMDTFNNSCDFLNFS